MARKKMPDTGAGTEARRLREAAGLSQGDVAGRIGVSASYLAQIERGERTGWNPDLLFALSRALGVTCAHWEPFFTPDAAPHTPPPARPRGRPNKSPDAGAPGLGSPTE